MLKAPYPWFGGKSRAADIIWPRFGNTPNYIEPFGGSFAILLANPWGPADYETVNERDPHVANFWRAVQPPDAEGQPHCPDETWIRAFLGGLPACPSCGHENTEEDISRILGAMSVPVVPSVHGDPDAVARYADNPVNEADLTAWHRYIGEELRSRRFRDRMLKDPLYYDPLIAGRWVWGLSCWIGDGWCKEGGRMAKKRPTLLRPYGVNKKGVRLEGSKRPHVSNSGVGVHRAGLRAKPRLSRYGAGVAPTVLKPDLREWMRQLSERFRYVRVCCGDWKRIMGPAVTGAATPCSIMLDPPYGKKADRTSNLYSADDLNVAGEVRKWCLENGGNEDFRIALCGYDGEGHEVLEKEGWKKVAWKAHGGYGRKGGKNSKGVKNSERERIWFSPGCLDPDGPIEKRRLL